MVEGGLIGATGRGEADGGQGLTLRQGRCATDALAGADVLVTGAGRGLGSGIAAALAAAGARVWLTSEVADELDWTASGIRAGGGRAEVCVADLAGEEGRGRVVRWMGDGADNLRAIVNNAGVLERQPIASIDREHWDRTLRVNLEAPVFLTRDLLPMLQRHGGSIINISSRAGAQGFPRQTAYCASKFGIEAFTRCLALELAGSRVSVNAVTPGIYLKPTSMTRREAEVADDATRARWEDPAMLGPAFVFLAGLRGEVSGCRFDARVLTQALERWGTEGVVGRVHDVAEYVQEGVQ